MNPEETAELFSADLSTRKEKQTFECAPLLLSTTAQQAKRGQLNTVP